MTYTVQYGIYQRHFDDRETAEAEVVRVRERGESAGLQKVSTTILELDPYGPLKEDAA
jgi:hypothetical protein